MATLLDPTDRRRRSRQASRRMFSLPPATLPYDPTRIPNLTGWFDASNATTIDTRPDILGDRVTEWRDVRGGATSKFTNPTADYQPVYETTSVFGKNAVRTADALDNWWGSLEGGLLNQYCANNAWTLMVVFVPDTFDHQANAVVWNDAPGWLGMFYENFTTLGLYQNGYLSKTIAAVAPPVYLATGIQRNTEMLFQLNNDAYETGARGPISNLNNPVVLGNNRISAAAAKSGEATPFNLNTALRGRLCEWLTYDRGLDDKEIAELTTGLYAKWNVGQVPT